MASTHSYSVCFGIHNVCALRHTQCISFAVSATACTAACASSCSLKNYMKCHDIYSRQHLAEMMQQALGTLPVLGFHLDALADVASRLMPLKVEFEKITYPQVSHTCHLQSHARSAARAPPARSTSVKEVVSLPHCSGALLLSYTNTHHAARLNTSVCSPCALHRQLPHRRHSRSAA
jgi:hypothetical protein